MSSVFAVHVCNTVGGLVLAIKLIYRTKGHRRTHWYPVFDLHIWATVSACFDHAQMHAIWEGSSQCMVCPCVLQTVRARPVECSATI